MHAAPENTLGSLKLGWEEGADAAEIDVWRTKDDQIVVSHDVSLKRTTGVDKSINDMTLAEVCTTEVNTEKFPRYAGEKIPSLAQVFAALPSEKRLIIEIKGNDAQLVPALKRVVDTSGVSLDRLYFSSFTIGQLQTVRKLMPEARTLLLWGSPWKKEKRPPEELDQIIKLSTSSGFSGLLLAEDLPLDETAAKKIHDNGLIFYMWSVHQVPFAYRMATLGASGLLVDRPAWIRNGIDQLARDK
ncbi:MAG: hypothetical protein LBK99_19035 [Opitutaceae bacterium]|jgi:glycerophosphoryl diester phosphodiesterase|nr:hypothetical protein [Opitutaceae bacterium]